MFRLLMPMSWQMALLFNVTWECPAHTTASLAAMSGGSCGPRDLLSQATFTLPPAMSGFVALLSRPIRLARRHRSRVSKWPSRTDCSGSRQHTDWGRALKETCQQVKTRHVKVILKVKPVTQWQPGTDRTPAESIDLRPRHFVFLHQTKY